MTRKDSLALPIIVLIVELLDYIMYINRGFKVVLVVLKASTRLILHWPNHAKDCFPENGEHQFPFETFRREKKYYV